jgi:hypothetical protein
MGPPSPFQESLSIVQYSHRVCSAHDISHTMSKMCVNKKCSKIHACEHLSHNFLIQNCRKQKDVLSPLLLYFALEYAIRKAQENQMELRFNGTH